MPRTTPRADTDRLPWASRSGWPTSAASRSKRYHSRNNPRGSPCCAGVISQAPAMDSGRIFTGFVSSAGPLEQVRQVVTVAALAQRLGEGQQLLVVDEAGPPGDLLD